MMLEGKYKEAVSQYESIIETLSGGVKNLSYSKTRAKFEVQLKEFSTRLEIARRKMN